MDKPLLIIQTSSRDSQEASNIQNTLMQRGLEYELAIVGDSDEEPIQFLYGLNTYLGADDIIRLAGRLQRKRVA